jgi:outer membrane protein assembly factor BamA
VNGASARVFVTAGPTEEPIDEVRFIGNRSSGQLGIAVAVAFADLGNVWGEGERFNVSSLRSSTGLGLSWISPIGPLKLSWGVPVKSVATDRIQRFQFQIGTGF